MLQKTLGTILLGLCLFSQALTAQECCEQTCCEPTCEPACCCCPNWSLETDWFPNHWYATAEFLYWKASEDNAAFASVNKFSETVDFINLTGTGLSKTKKEELHFKWKPGLRLGVGYIFPCADWSATFTYTHLYSHASRGKEVPTGSFFPVPNPAMPTISGQSVQSTFLPPNAFSGSLNTPCNSIHGHWKLKFDNYEWDLRHRVDLACCFSICPYIGFKLLNIRQHYRIDYEINPVPTFNFGTIEQKFKTKFSGVGLQGGFDANWFLGCGFSIYSNVSGGVSYGRAHIHETIVEDVNFSGGGSEVITLRFKDAVHIARPNLDFAFGLQWQKPFDCYLVAVNLGWEYHHYFNQNFFRLAQDNDSGKGDLTLHGLTAGLEVLF